jgi:predicted nucleic acid-binding protein
MSVVVDANLVAATVLPVPYSDQATQRIRAWKQAGVELLAPLLLEYEVASVLRRAVVARWLTNDDAVEALGQILTLRIQCLPPTPLLHEKALHWAYRLGHTKTYDAHYMALAEQEGAEMWTADKRLVNGARQTGVSWVHWIGQAQATV